MSDMYSLVENPQVTLRSEYRMKQPFRSTNMGLNSISYFGPNVWNTLPTQYKLEDNSNKSKHKIKDHFFKNIQRVEDDIYLYY